MSRRILIKTEKMVRRVLFKGQIGMRSILGVFGEFEVLPEPDQNVRSITDYVATLREINSFNDRMERLVFGVGMNVESLTFKTGNLT